MVVRNPFGAPSSLDQQQQSHPDIGLLFVQVVTAPWERPNKKPSPQRPSADRLIISFNLNQVG